MPSNAVPCKFRARLYYLLSQVDGGPLQLLEL